MEFEPTFNPDKREKKEKGETEKDKNPENKNEIKEGDPKIEALEKANLSSETKRDILLILLEEKSVTRIGGAIDLESKSEKAEKRRQRIEHEIKEIKKVIKELDLPSEVMETQVKKEDKQTGRRVDILIGKNQESIERIKEINKNPTKTENEREAGKLYGYPPTAVETYAKRGGLIDPEKDKEILREKEAGLENFVNFRLSKEHLEEEIEFIKKHKELIKEASPQIYKELKENN